MNEDKIDEAAKMYAFHKCDEKDIDQYDLDYLLFNAFCSGINWFLENLWHDASEKPRAFVYILAETEEFHKGYKTLMFHGGDPWEKLVKYNGITRWLYIEDLMKGGK